MVLNIRKVRESMATSLRKKKEPVEAFALDADMASWSAIGVGSADVAASTGLAPIDDAASPRAAAPDRVLRGHIDVAKWPRIKGWAWDPDAPDERVRLELAEGHRRLLTVVASLGRPDLATAGISDGLHGFDVDLNDSPLGAGRRVVALRCADTGAELPGSPITLDVPASAAVTFGAAGDPAPARSSQRPPHVVAAAQPPASSYADADRHAFQGFVDGVDAEWRLSGWACDPAAAEPLTVELVEGETVLATARAGEFREDLLAAGLRDGNCAFYIRVPAKLFDGKFRNLQVYGRGGAGREPIGKPFGIVFPRLSRVHGKAPAAIPAIEIFEQVSGTPVPVSDRPGGDVIDETSAVLEQLGERFGHAAAMGLLYAYALRRPIDNDGLATRLSRIDSDSAAYKSIVQEVMYSEEAGLIHGPSKYLSLHPLEFLRVWIDGRFGILELPA